MKRAIWLLLLFSWLTSCKTNNNNELTDQQKVKIVNEIEGIVSNFLSPSGLNYEGHTKLRANTPGYVYAGDGKILWTDFATYETATKSIFSNIRGFSECNVLKNYVYVLCPDAASSTVEFRGKYITAQGDTIVHNGCWTFVFRKFANEWKVIQENGTHTKE